MTEFNHPFYQKTIVRVALVCICIGWGVFEFMTNSPGFGIIFLALGVWLFWRLFIVFKD